jgi:hypothetical protein
MQYTHIHALSSSPFSYLVYYSSPVYPSPSSLLKFFFCLFCGGELVCQAGGNLDCRADSPFYRAAVPSSHNYIHQQAWNSANLKVTALCRHQPH